MEPGTAWPERVQLNDETFAMRLFLLMEAFDWRFLPSQILAEDPDILEDLLELRRLFALMKRLFKDDDDG